MCSGEDVHTQASRRVKADPVPTLHVQFVDAVRDGTVAEPSFRRGAVLQAVLDQCFSADAMRSEPLWSGG